MSKYLSADIPGFTYEIQAMLGNQARPLSTAAPPHMQQVPADGPPQV